MIVENGVNASQKIDRFIGKRSKFNFRKPKSIGSPGLYLQLFHHIPVENPKLPPNARCNFEKRPHGLLVHADSGNGKTHIAMPKNEILEIELTRGLEQIDPVPFYLFWALLKLGVPLRKARYFGLRKNQYSIEPMQLSLKSKEYEMKFVANGFLFERHLAFLKSLEFRVNLKVAR